MEDPRPLVKELQLGGRPHLSVARSEAAFVPVMSDRGFGSPIVLAARRPLSAAAGDADGDGHQDLVLACRERGSRAQEQRSRRTEVEMASAPGSIGAGQTGSAQARRRGCPASARAMSRWTTWMDDGRDEIILCQHHDAESYTTHSLVYRVGRAGIAWRRAGDARRAADIGGTSGSQAENPSLFSSTRPAGHGWVACR